MPLDFGISVEREASSSLEDIAVVLIILYFLQQYALFSWDQHVREQNHSEIHDLFQNLINIQCHSPALVISMEENNDTSTELVE